MTMRLNYNGNDIDLKIGPAGVRPYTIEKKNINFSGGGVHESIIHYSKNIVEVDAYWEDAQQRLLEAWWDNWARDDGEFSFAKDKSKMGYSTLLWNEGENIEQVKYLFHNNTYSFVPTSCALESFFKFMRVTASASSPNIYKDISPDLNGAYSYIVRIKLRRTSGTWLGSVNLYGTTKGGWYNVTLSEPAVLSDGDWVIIEADFENETGFTSDTIEALSLYLFSDAASEYDIEWIRISTHPKAVQVSQTDEFSAGDECLLIGAGDAHREIVVADSVSATTITTVDDVYGNFTTGDVVRHRDYYPALISLDDDFNPDKSGQSWTTKFKWLEVRS